MVFVLRAEIFAVSIFQKYALYYAKQWQPTVVLNFINYAYFLQDFCLFHD